MKWIHIVAGLLALLAGFTALYAAKGGTFHRRSGLVFVAAMLTMTSTAVVMATWISPNVGNVIAGSMTSYLVVSSLLTVRRVPYQHGIDVGLMLMAGIVSIVAFVYASEVAAAPRGVIDGIPAAPLYLFAGIALLAFIGDVRVLRRGPLQGRSRIARHLWRMTFAMWVATTSFFIGQPRFLPEPLRGIGVRAIPVLIVTVLLFYWLVRTLRRKRRPVPAMAVAAHIPQS